MTIDHGLYESAFSFAPIGMAMVSLEGKFLKLNEAFCTLLGFTAEELLSKNFQQITHSEDLVEDLNLVHRMLNKEITSYQLEKRYIRKDGELLWVHLSVSLHNNVFISQVIDISEIKRAQLALVYNSKMIALGEMTVGLAHEINNPLAIIGLYASSINEVLKEETIDRPKVNLFLKKINDTVTRINAIVISLKKLYVLSDDSHYSPIHAKDVINDSLTLCFEKFKSSGVKLETDISDIVFEGRTVEIAQVLVNLLNNAYYAVRGVESRFISIKAFEFNDCIHFEVSDSGPGVPADIRSRIMEPFFTTKPIGEGTGLGLSISQKIVEAHHGKLLLLDSPETTFVVQIPLLQP
jgi:PAS domain S-box-containing protein